MIVSTVIYGIFRPELKLPYLVNMLNVQLPSTCKHIMDVISIYN